MELSINSVFISNRYDTCNSCSDSCSNGCWIAPDTCNVQKNERQHGPSNAAVRGGQSFLSRRVSHVERTIY